MELKEARELYARKTKGKCANCKFATDKRGYAFCLVRQETIDISFFTDYMMVKFCQYFEFNTNIEK